MQLGRNYVPAFVAADGKEGGNKPLRASVQSSFSQGVSQTWMNSWLGGVPGGHGYESCKWKIVSDARLDLNCFQRGGRGAQCSE